MIDPIILTRTRAAAAAAQVVGQEGADLTTIDVVRMLEEEHGFSFVRPPMPYAPNAPHARL